MMAGASRGTPRVANRIVRRMRDFAQFFGDGAVTREVVADGLARLQIDPLGLDGFDRAILLAIIEKFGGGPVGAETLAISLGEAQDTLEDYYEPFLIQCGMIQRTPRGRVATPKAYEHLRLDRPGAGGPELF